MNDKHHNTCLDHADDDEPLFVLRAADELAPYVVEHWIERARARGVNQAKLEDAEQVIAAMLQWAQHHGAHKPD